MILTALLLMQSAVPDLGAKTFAMTCAVGYCHGAGGAANRGPRLQGRDFERSYLERVIRSGIPNTAMPGFAGRLKTEELDSVIEYVVRIAANRTGKVVPGPAAVPVIGESASQAVPGADAPQSRGEMLFFDATRDVRCGTCHQASGRGMKVALWTAATLPSKPKNLKQVRLRDGGSFPAMVIGEGADSAQVWDLTVPPPVLRTLPKAEIASIGSDATWAHEAVTKGYTKQELEEVLRFMASVRE